MDPTCFSVTDLVRAFLLGFVAKAALDFTVWFLFERRQ
jgi:hypothetical protein